MRKDEAERVGEQMRENGQKMREKIKQKVKYSSLSVIIPAFNEEKHIAQTLRGVRCALPGAEIIVVDDGSADSTAAVAAKYARVVKRLENRGKGAAMRLGVRAARRRLVLFIDASQFFPEDAGSLVSAFRSAGGMIVGVRDWGVIPWPRRGTNALTRLAVFLGTGRLVRDPLSGFRLLSRQDFLAFNTKEERYCIEVETVFKALAQGLAVTEVPVRVSYAGLPSLRLGSARTQPSLFLKQRFLDEMLFNIKTVLRLWLGLGV